MSIYGSLNENSLVFSDSGTPICEINTSITGQLVLDNNSNGYVTLETTTADNYQLPRYEITTQTKTSLFPATSVEGTPILSNQNTTGKIFGRLLVENWSIIEPPVFLNFTCIAWSPELRLFVAAAVSSLVITSPDGITWSSINTGIGGITEDIVWSPEVGRFVTVASFDGGSQWIRYSSDGINWSGVSLSTNAFQGVTWSPELGIYCAVANSGTNRAITSIDGIVWNNRSLSSNDWRSVAWSPKLGIFCVVGYDNVVSTSPDGIIWTNTAITPVGEYNSVTWSPELEIFCAVGNSSSTDVIITSSDGTTWTASQTPFATNDWNSVTWSPELEMFCAVGTVVGSDKIITSYDGIKWVTRNEAPTTTGLYGLTWSPELGIFCAVGDDSTNDRIATSMI